MALDEVEALRASLSPILLKNSTIQHLKDLSIDMPLRDNKDTFDELIVDMIRVYRKKKGLGEIWGSD